MKIAKEMAMINGRPILLFFCCYLLFVCSTITHLFTLSLLARILPPPTISYHPSSKMANFAPRDGAWNLKDKKVASGATLGSWGVVVFGTERDLPMTFTNGFIRELIVTCTATGMVRNNCAWRVRVPTNHGS